ncbi:hypothetical protein EGJ28_15940 [Stutzerimonas xanthomarina]|jgi:hypothetical protein|uniref:Uncharacterized protein n=1 Tax=Stutzerimonas xanthomarina TaxID=271420 RepID=A0A427DYB9_9GAMM|nr:hypothetical protein EGJ28_15940 [Stutzerimonas xanthomarina]
MPQALPPSPVRPHDQVVFTPHGTGDVIRGTVFQSLDTSGGNWRVRIVLAGEPFPHGLSRNVYSHEGCFEITGALDVNGLPA